MRGNGNGNVGKCGDVGKWESEEVGKWEWREMGMGMGGNENRKSRNGEMWGRRNRGNCECENVGSVSVRSVNGLRGNKGSVGGSENRRKGESAKVSNRESA